MPEPSPESVREELERVVSSAGFAGAGRLAPFLRFLVERALAGEPVKEALIGVEVFGRPADYDPRIDPIVRVEARRLRSRLAEYYDGPGGNAALRIELPKGAYVPAFILSEPPARPTVVSPRTRRWLFPAVLGMGALAIAVLVFLFARRPAMPAHPIVAVLPFVNFSGEQGNEYFSDGLTEEVIDRLAKVQGLRVVARSSVFQYKGRSQDLREIGQKLQATAVVEGSVRRSGDRLRVTAQLIDVADGLHLWSETYERKMAEVFAIQDDIARSIANALRAELRVGFWGQTPPPTANVEAYQLYLKGRHHLNHDALAGFELAADAFERAIAADPQFAAAHVFLATDYGMLGYYKLRPPDEIWPKAKAAAERAIALNPDLAMGHAALGFELGMYEWKWAEAERAGRRAVAIDPNSAESHLALAVSCLMPTGRLSEAAAEYARALELDPNMYLAAVGAAFTSLAAGRYSDAIAQYRRAIELNPSFGDTQWDLGMAYAMAGRKDDAMKQFRLGGQINRGGDWRPGPIELGLLGDAAAARRILAETPDFAKERPIFTAFTYGVLGDAARAADCLEKAYAARDPQLIWIKIDPRLAKVRSDARIAGLIAKLGL